MTKKLTSTFAVMAGIIGVLWCLELADMFTGHRLDQMAALQPRSLQGLGQIFTSPWLHGGLGHLFSNTLGFLPLGTLMLIEGAFWPVLLLTMILGGLGTWLFAAQASIGFSGILFGFMGYLMTRGFHQRNLKSIALSLLAISWFGGGLLWGLVPQAHISWAGHFWGFVGGAIAARYWKS